MNNQNFNPHPFIVKTIDWVSVPFLIKSISFLQHQQTLKVRVFLLCRYLEDNRIAELPREIFDSNVKLTKL